MFSNIVEIVLMHCLLHYVPWKFYQTALIGHLQLQLVCNFSKSISFKDTHREKNTLK